MKAAMSLQRRKTAQGVAAAALAALAGGCDYDLGSPFGQFPQEPAGRVARADFPTLLQAREAAERLGPSPDPAIGEQVVQALDVEAAVSTAEAQRLSPPVTDAAALQAEGEAVRREGRARAGR